MYEISTLLHPSYMAEITIGRKKNIQLILNTKFKSQIENQMSSHMLLGTSSYFFLFFISSGLLKCVLYNFRKRISLNSEIDVKMYTQPLSIT